MVRRIADLPKHEQPREKMQSRGPGALSDAEPVAIVLGSGTRNHDVMAVANRIVRLVDDHHSRPDPAELHPLLTVPG